MKISDIVEQRIAVVDAVVNHFFDSVDRMEQREVDEIFEELAQDVDACSLIYCMAHEAREHYESNGKPIPSHVLSALDSTASAVADLKYATVVIGGKNLTPASVRTRIIKITSILTLGGLSAAFSLWAVWAGLPQSDGSRLLTIFFLLGSLALILSCFLGLLLTTWSGYVSAHIQAEQGKIL